MIRRFLYWLTDLLYFLYVMSLAVIVYYMFVRHSKSNQEHKTFRYGKE